MERAIERFVTNLLAHRTYGPWLRYGGSALIVAAAILLRFALDLPLRHYPLLIFVPAVFLCALLFDKNAGIFATILSAFAAAFFFIAPFWSFDIGLLSWLALAIFAFIGAAMSTIVDLLRKTIFRLNESETAKALLLEELAHRTQNDLSIISSAITLQGGASENPDVRHALEAANSRVLVVAQAQQRLREDKKGGSVDLRGHIIALCEGLGDLLRNVRPIAVRVQCENMRVPSAVAVHVGLIINELVTNSLKYAYPGERGGIVNVELHAENSKLIIVVTDDGIGCADDIAPGLGSKLVRLLAKRLGGSVERERTAVGFRMKVIIEDASFSAPA